MPASAQASVGRSSSWTTGPRRPPRRICRAGFTCVASGASRPRCLRTPGVRRRLGRCPVADRRQLHGPSARRAALPDRRATTDGRRRWWNVPSSQGVGWRAVRASPGGRPPNFRHPTGRADRHVRRRWLRSTRAAPSTSPPGPPARTSASTAAEPRPWSRASGSPPRVHAPGVARASRPPVTWRRRWGPHRHGAEAEKSKRFDSSGARARNPGHLSLGGRGGHGGRGTFSLAFKGLCSPSVAPTVFRQASSKRFDNRVVLVPPLHRAWAFGAGVSRICRTCHER